MGDWRRLHKEQLYDLFSYYYSSDQIEKNEIGRACGTYERQESYIQDFDGETRGNEPLRKPRRR